MASYRTWIRTLFFLGAVPLMAVGIFNYFMDPLWCFSHSHRWNNAQLDLNDRQQKTNVLVFQKPDFDSILIGSSISTFIDHNDFKGMKLYNYASPLMRPWEYSGYIANARKASGGELKNIIIGYDFFGSKKSDSRMFDEPAKYYETANSFLYRYKTLFNMKTFDFSKRNLAQARKATRPIYRRDYVRSYPRSYAQKLTGSGQYILDYDLKKYQYDDETKNLAGRIKEETKGTHLSVFVTPLSKPLFCHIVKEGFLPTYERWLGDLVDSFGEVYNFMYINSVTAVDANFSDIGHFNPEVGTLIARRITGEERPREDFGVLVTRSNLTEHLKFIEENSRACTNQP